MVEQTSNIEVKLHEKISQKLMEIKLDSRQPKDRGKPKEMFVLKFITNERKNITREGSQKRSRKM